MGITINHNSQVLNEWMNEPYFNVWLKMLSRNRTGLFLWEWKSTLCHPHIHRWQRHIMHVSSDQATPTLDLRIWCLLEEGSVNRNRTEDVLEDRGFHCSCSLTDETGKSSGHIHMLIEKGHIVHGRLPSDHTLPGSYASHTLSWTH